MAMATRTDWEAAAKALMASERERLGGPLTVAEVDAYYRGELPEEQAARVRALLVYGDGEPVLTPEELAEDRAKLYAAIAASERRRRWVPFAAIAATLLVAAFLAEPWLAFRRAAEPQLVASRHVLRPSRIVRGPATD